MMPLVAWRRVKRIEVREKSVRQHLECGHVRSRKLSELNETARQHPERMAGASVPCETCALEVK